MLRDVTGATDSFSMRREVQVGEETALSAFVHLRDAHEFTPCELTCGDDVVGRSDCFVAGKTAIEKVPLCGWSAE
jgi:hypothetical protein